MGCCDDYCVSPKESREPLKHDPNFNGPIHNRSCTDVIWLIIFILFLGVWGFVGYIGFTQGNVERLLAPFDSKGQRCGLDKGLQDKKYLVFFDITQCLQPGTPLLGCPTKQVCVEQCPQETIFFKTELTRENFATYRNKLVCSDEVNTQTMTFDEAIVNIDKGSCANYVLKSQPVLFRCIGDLSTLPCNSEAPRAQTLWARSEEGSQICLRKPKERQKELMSSATALDSYVGWIAGSWVGYFTSGADELHTQALSMQIVQDLVQSRWYMLGALVAVVVVCFLYILLLRWIVAPVVWTSIVGLFALLGFALYKCYTSYVYYKAHPVSLQTTTNVKGYLSSWFAKAETWMVLLVVLAIVVLILLLIIIFLRSRIVIAIALIKEGSKAVTSVKTTIFFPIIPWLFQCVVIAYGVVVLMYLMSIGKSTFNVVNMDLDPNCQCDASVSYSKDQAPCNPSEFYKHCYDNRHPEHTQQCANATCHFSGLDPETNLIYLYIFVNLLGFFWAMAFIGGIADMMLASTFSTWYWQFHKRDLPFFTLTSGIYRTVRYHLGTVAFGSLIIAIVRVIRVILEYIDHKLKKFDNPFTRCVMCCCKCFFWCLDNFIKFINKNAYIMCAVHGKSFCSSARDAFSLLMRNIVRVVVLDKVMDFLFLLSKLLISIGVGFAVYYILEWNLVYEVTQGERLHYNYVPAIILSVATYFISSIFFNVYAMAVDTLFLCFLEDCERNDGTPEKPYFMSKNLQKILSKRNKTA